VTDVATYTGDGIDLADPDLYTRDDGIAAFDLLRERHPVYWNRKADGYGFWALLRYADAVEVFRHPESFTSERGMQVGQEEAAARAAAGRMLIVTDGARHAQLRDVMNPLLTPAAIRRLEGAMRDVVGDALTRMAERDSFDFVAEIAGRLPLSVICQLLGVPREDWDLMIDWTRIAFGSIATDEVVTDAQKSGANASIFAYYGDLVRERRRNPGSDIVSALCQATLDGRPLTDDEILLNINGLITGGNETTRHASAGSVLAFMRFPDQWRRLKAEPDLARTAVEEVLRWTAPSLNVMRTALTEITIGGQPIRPGERVSVWNPAVNRDPDAFPDAGRFDIARTPNRHLTFGMGRHLCIGAALARFELLVLLSEMAARVRTIHQTGTVKRLRSNLMWGVDRVPVRIELEDRVTTR
jgi:cytochrome P450